MELVHHFHPALAFRRCRRHLRPHLHDQALRVRRRVYEQPSTENVLVPRLCPSQAALRGARLCAARVRQDYGVVFRHDARLDTSGRSYRGSHEERFETIIDIDRRLLSTVVAVHRFILLQERLRLNNNLKVKMIPESDSDSDSTIFNVQLDPAMTGFKIVVLVQL